MRLKSGATIYQTCAPEADKHNYLTRQTLAQMHLMPSGDPVAYDIAPDGDIIYYFDPARVVEAPPETWYFPGARKDTMTLESGTVIGRMRLLSESRFMVITAHKICQHRQKFKKLHHPHRFVGFCPAFFAQKGLECFNQPCAAVGFIHCTHY